MSLYGLADSVAKGLLRLYLSATAIYNATPVLATETAIDVSSIVPPQAVAVLAIFSLTNGATATTLEVYQNAGEAQANQKLVYAGVANQPMQDCFIVALDSARKFYIKETAAVAATLIKWVGWFEKAPISQPLNIAQF